MQKWSNFMKVNIKYNLMDLKKYSKTHRNTAKEASWQIQENKNATTENFSTHCGN